MIDPRRSRTADEADEHHFIRPGTDALLLFAMVHVLFAEGLVAPGRRSPSTSPAWTSCASWRAVHARGRRRRRPASPPTTSAAWRASSPRRRGGLRLRPHRHCTQEFGTLAAGWSTCSTCSPATSTAPGGAMFTAAAVGLRQHGGEPGRGDGAAGRTAGPRASAGAARSSASCRSSPARGDRDARRGPDPRADHDRRQPGAVDARRRPARRRARHARLHGQRRPLLNETTRHAHVILPPPSPLERSHYDAALYAFAVRNVAKYSPPVFEREAGAPTSGRSCCA